MLQLYVFIRVLVKLCSMIWCLFVIYQVLLKFLQLFPFFVELHWDALVFVIVVNYDSFPFFVSIFVVDFFTICSLVLAECRISLIN